EHRDVGGERAQLAQGGVAVAGPARGEPAQLQGGGEQFQQGGLVVDDEHPPLRPGGAGRLFGCGHGSSLRGPGRCSAASLGRPGWSRVRGARAARSDPSRSGPLAEAAPPPGNRPAAPPRPPAGSGGAGRAGSPGSRPPSTAERGDGAVDLRCLLRPTGGAIPAPARRGSRASRWSRSRSRRRGGGGRGPRRSGGGPRPEPGGESGPSGCPATAEGAGRAVARRGGPVRRRGRDPKSVVEGKGAARGG